MWSDTKQCKLAIYASLHFLDLKFCWYLEDFENLKLEINQFHDSVMKCIPSGGESYRHTHREPTWIISRWAKFEDNQLAHSELTRWAYIVNLLWAHCELTAITAWWAYWVISLIGHSKPTVWVILWVRCELTKCPQN